MFYVAIDEVENLPIDKSLSYIWELDGNTEAAVTFKRRVESTACLIQTTWHIGKLLQKSRISKLF